MTPSDDVLPPTRRFEAVVFLALSVLIWPVLAVGIVGAYGFSVWMYQLLFAHPTF